MEFIDFVIRTGIKYRNWDLSNIHGKFAAAGDVAFAIGIVFVLFGIFFSFEPFSTKTKNPQKYTRIGSLPIIIGSFSIAFALIVDAVQMLIRVHTTGVFFQ